MKRIRNFVILLLIFLPALCYGQIFGCIDIFVSGPIAIVVQNSQGQQAGYDPKTNTYYEEIKGFAYGPAGTGSELPGEPPINGWDFVSSKIIRKPFQDSYRLTVIGEKAGHYQISAGMTLSFTKGKDIYYEGSIDSLEVKNYEFFYTTDTTRALYFRECMPPAPN